ncbi:hypothetical protein AAU57_07395 [Nonlabens sp. YIK11]|uniref:hypothetical protein n=1 Tax=Nonlabens sp. YIK11 TaxID=1453349 RepID=UPI0006DC8D9E|nr:hypothetical protein [Nonlabens sp. YIK11]KQC33155.1 hypothetical protein AAU57_07395 [Nonlabens sp. YIK11]
MNAFVGKSHYLRAILFLLGIAFAKAQSTTTTSQNDIHEISITSKDDRTSLFKKINMIKDAYGITTKFKDYELGRVGLTAIELEFAPAVGSSQTIKSIDASGITPQVLRIEKSTKRISYAGAASGNTKALATNNAAPEVPKPVTKSQTTSTYSIKSTTVTDPDKLEESQVDQSGPQEITAQEKAALEAERKRAAQEVEAAAQEKAAALQAEKEAAAQKVKEEQLAAQRAQPLKEAEALKLQQEQLKAQKAALEREELAKKEAIANQQAAAQAQKELEAEQAKGKLEKAAQEKAAAVQAEKEAAAQKAKEVQLAAQKAQEQKEAEALKKQQEQLEAQKVALEREELAKKEALENQQAATQAQKELMVQKTPVAPESPAIKEKMVEKSDLAQSANEAAQMEMENDLVVRNKKKVDDAALAALKAKEKKAVEQDDDASMKATIAELKKLQDREARKVKKTDVKSQGYVFINAQQYTYEVYKSRTLVYDAMERTVLVLPMEVDDRPVSGTVSISGLRYQFNLKNNIITLKNGAGELVDLEGNKL